MRFFFLVYCLVYLESLNLAKRVLGEFFLTHASDSYLLIRNRCLVIFVYERL